jgi:hypothetical protein
MMRVQRISNFNYIIKRSSVSSEHCIHIQWTKRKFTHRKDISKYKCGHAKYHNESQNRRDVGELNARLSKELNSAVRVMN